MAMTYASIAKTSKQPTSLRNIKNAAIFRKSAMSMLPKLSVCVQILDAYGYGPYAKVRDLPVKSPEPDIYTKLLALQTFQLLHRLMKARPGLSCPPTISISMALQTAKIGNVDPDLGQPFAFHITSLTTRLWV